MIWKPDVTVAAVVCRDGRYLLVEEETCAGLRLNQPAGHLECGERLVDAVARETFEETAYRFLPAALVGIYHWRNEEKELTYLRFAFAGELRGWEADAPLDEGIVGVLWLTLAELRACPERHRSPMVLRCIEDHAAGRRFPLDLLTHLA